MLYVIYGFLLGIFVAPGILGWYELAPVWLVALDALFIVGTLSWIWWVLDRRHFYVTL